MENKDLKEFEVNHFSGFGVIVGFLLISVILIFLTMINLLWFFLIIPLFIVTLMGFKILKPQEAMVFTFFGKYAGSLKKEGFYWINPFLISASADNRTIFEETGYCNKPIVFNHKISLKAITLQNGKQKVNDKSGNPIEIGIVVIWKVENPTKAIFNVDNYYQYVSIQSDSALRNIVRLYPYDAPIGSNQDSLRGSSTTISDKLEEEIQQKVEIAGIKILEAKITHLAYAPEIAAAMLQRQQAEAIVDARKMIVEGAVSIVEMALDKITKNQEIKFSDENKAKMVSNLLVVLCSNKDPQAVVNTGIES